MKLVVILLVITLVNAVPHLQQQEQNGNHQLNPLNDEEAHQEAKEQNKRTLFGPTFIGGTRHVGIHPSGFKYVLGYGPVGYYPYAKPITVLKPVIHSHGWKPIIRVPVARPIFKPVKPIHHYPHVHVHPAQPVQPVVPVQPVQPVHPVQPEPVQPIVPVEKPVIPVVPAPPTFVKPLVPLQPQLLYFYPFFKPLGLQHHVVQPALHVQPPIVTPVIQQHHPVVQPIVPQHPLPQFTPQFPQFVHQFPHQFPVNFPGVANPVGPIEHTNSVHTSYSATFPKHPIIGVHTPQPVVPPFVHPIVQPPVLQHPINHPPVVHPSVISPQGIHPFQPTGHPGLPIPIQPHLLHVIRQFPHLFKHITPLYPVNNPGEIPVGEIPKPIVPPATIHHPFTPQDNGASVQIPSHLPEHPNYRPEIPNFYPLPTDQGVHNGQVPNFQQEQHGHVDNSFGIQQHQPQPVHPQTPLYLPPHPFLRQNNGNHEQINSVQTEFSATYPRNAGIHQPSISLEAPYRRSDDRSK